MTNWLYQINWFAIGAFSTFLACSSLVFIFFRYGYEKSHKSFAIFQLTVALWALGVTFASTTDNPLLAYRYWLISHTLGIFVAVIFFHFSFIFCDIKSKPIITACYAYSALMVFLTLTNNGHYLYSGVELKFGNIYYLKAKAIFWALMTPWFTLAILGNLIVFQFNKIKSSKKHKEATIILYTSLLGYCGGCSTFLPMAGFNFYPLTIFLTAIYPLIVSYYIFRDKIFQLNIFIKTGLIYSILLSLITTSYIILIFLAGNLIGVQTGYTSPTQNFLIVLFLTILAIPLKNWVQTTVDKIFLRGSPIQIAEENQLLRREMADKEKFKAVAALASGVAHEIRNPLTALNTFVEYFPQKKNDPEFLEKFTKVANSEVVRINELVQELLDFAKPSPLQLQPTSIPDIIKQSLNLLSNQIKKNNIQVVENISPDSSNLISADPNKLKQAFINLFMNAIDAMPNGGTLTISTERTQNALYITVSDTGHGINPKDTLHIFEPFYSSKEKGTGLGLAIVKQIIEEHSGKIEVKSKLHQGTVLKITLRLQ